ncbi:hypothetical protein CPB83DRAFT_853823 [Crepidotus variabilis]|uniref:Uncharacterized protein n=1 Tax=Crepidotus variabilis TaxID=179855 RepID=A0A9P6EH85_9AGAR|nr:hypothetical protein CPB83DRAFT_853823 [Crepidotus variabilis]
MARQPTIDHLPPPVHQTNRFTQRERPLTYYLADVLKALFVLAIVAGLCKGLAVFEGWIATKGGAVIPEGL